MNRSFDVTTTNNSEKENGRVWFQNYIYFRRLSRVLIKVVADTVMKYFEMAERAALSNFP